MNDTVTNPIIRSSFFWTPNSYEALNKMISSLPAEERALAFKISVLTSNLCHKLVEDELYGEDLFAS